MNNPKCPYCGSDMKLWDDGYGMLWYSCPKCLAEAPVAHTEEAAYAAAMKRKKPKGRWIETEQPCGWHDITCATCTACGEDFPLGEYEIADVIEDWHFCPNCGADMRKEANDE